MRVKKQYGPELLLNPCAGMTYGQAEDYSIDVTAHFPAPYCGPLSFYSATAPITLVSVADINNVTNATINGTPAHENFTTIQGTMRAGNSYPVALEGNTNGNLENRFVVFIDWNQNDILDDAGEVYEITEALFNSTGADGQQATGTIVVPIDAMIGTTRMRVKKVLRINDYLNPCKATDDGQAEDYTIFVQAPIDYVYEDGTWTPEDPSGISRDINNISVFNGTAIITGVTGVKNLTIDAGATLEIHNVLNLYGNVTNNGNFVFMSTATSNGELGPVSANSTITGEVTVQRYMSNNRSYRMVSSAVTTTTSIHDNWQEGAESKTDNPSPDFGTHITGSTTDQQSGFDGTGTGNPSMFTVNIATQQFVPIDNTDVNTLNAGEAFLLFVRGDRSIVLNNNSASSETVLRATGSLFTGTKTLNFPTADVFDFVMIGNPYQSAVDIKSVMANSTSIVSNGYYVYDPTLADHGKYVTVRLRTGDGTNTDGSAANKYLQPGQGAQVMAGDLAPTIVFNESNKAPGNFTTSNRNTMSEDNMLTVQLYTTENYNNGGPVHDSFGIIFEDGYNNEINFMDAIKPMNFYENLGIDHNGTYLSIEEREMPQLGEVYPMFSTGYQHSEYTLRLTVDGLEAIALYLDDNFNGTSTILEDGDNTYSFSIDANDPLSKATDRFSIRTQERLGVNDTNLLSGIQLFPNPLDGNTFYINAPKLNGEQLLVSISDLTGRRIFQQNLECQANMVTVPMGNDVASGVYLVTLKLNGEEQTYRLIKE